MQYEVLEDGDLLLKEMSWVEGVGMGLGATYSIK